MFNLTLNYENFPLELEGFQMCSECPEELNYTFCLPNGCYEVDLETEFPISAEFILIQAFLNGIEIPDAILELSQGDDNGTLVWGSTTFPTGTAVSNGPSLFIPGGEWSVTFNRLTDYYRLLKNPMFMTLSFTKVISVSL